MTLAHINCAELQAECEEVVLWLSNLLQVTGLRQSVAALAEMLKHAPRHDRAMAEDSLYRRCSIAATSSGSSWTMSDLDGFRRFENRLFKLAPERRALLEASIVGTLVGFGIAK